jgi:prolyl 4-hydroxylase
MKDPPRGRLLFEYAAAYGHVEASLLATNLLASGIAGKRDWPAALARLRNEAAAIPMRQTAVQLIDAMDLDSNGDPVGAPEPRRLSDEPNAVLFERLLTPAECHYLMQGAGDRFEPSMVFNEARELVRDTIRTSDGATIHWLIEDPAIVALNRRIAAASGTAYEDGEALQVLRYVPGQEYRPHFDWLNQAPNQRLWTALVYVNDDYEGGATKFVRTGLEVRGKTGDVLLFSNAAPDGHGDPLAEHAGLPVTSGTKYLATRWIREARWIP